MRLLPDRLRRHRRLRDLRRRPPLRPPQGQPHLPGPNGRGGHDVQPVATEAGEGGDGAAAVVGDKVQHHRDVHGHAGRGDKERVDRAVQVGFRDVWLLAEQVFVPLTAYVH